jgi:hypothetical protein
MDGIGKCSTPQHFHNQWRAPNGTFVTLMMTIEYINLYYQEDRKDVNSPQVMQPITVFQLTKLIKLIKLYVQSRWRANACDGY